MGYSAFLFLSKEGQIVSDAFSLWMHVVHCQCLRSKRLRYLFSYTSSTIPLEWLVATSASGHACGNSGKSRTPLPSTVGITESQSRSMRPSFKSYPATDAPPQIQIVPSRSVFSLSTSAAGSPFHMRIPSRSCSRR